MRRAWQAHASAGLFSLEFAWFHAVNLYRVHSEPECYSIVRVLHVAIFSTPHHLHAKIAPPRRTRYEAELSGQDRAPLCPRSAEHDDVRVCFVGHHNAEVRLCRQGIHDRIGDRLSALCVRLLHRVRISDGEDANGDNCDAHSRDEQDALHEFPPEVIPLKTDYRHRLSGFANLMSWSLIAHLPRTTR